MRRWLWPYAILAIVLTLIGFGVLFATVSEVGFERAGAELAAANAFAVEPLHRFLISMLEMILPFELPSWFKSLYATLVVVALVGLVLSILVGLLLLPIFYALAFRAR